VLIGDARLARIHYVQAVIAQHHAIKEDENETVQRQAREDIKKHGSGRTH
jgi:hypothetical protein